MNQCTHCHGEGQTAVCLTVPESRTVRDRLTIDIRVAGKAYCDPDSCTKGLPQKPVKEKKAGKSGRDYG